MNDNKLKHLKTVLLVTLILGLMGASSAFAFRGMGGGGMGGGMGCGMGGGMGHGMGMRGKMNLTPEQAGQVFDLRQKFMNDTAELRKSLMVKGAELAQLWKAESPDEKAIQAKVKELGALKTQMMEKAVAQRLAMNKIVPGAMGHCPMMGPGRGPCPMMGPGQGPKKGASLAPGQDEMAGNDTALDLEIAQNQGPAW